jgi:uncharacterized protein (DUF488 family)
MEKPPPAEASEGRPSSIIYSIGHSTHTTDVFATLLQRHGVVQVADVRTVPRSRRHPQFSRETLPDWLAARGLVYRHFPGLGGLRRPRPDSPNTAWQHPSFRGYADHMATDEFRRSVDELAVWAAPASTAVMCAEALWWRCHRRLLADALVMRGWAVSHILASGAASAHEMTPFARIVDGALLYPGLL